MQSKFIRCLSGISVVLGIMFITACSKKDSPGNPGGGDPNNPGIETGAPEKYTKKVLIEEFTGAWCGWCPRMPVLLEKLHAKYPNVIISAFHASDTFDIGRDVRTVIEEKLGVQGYPTSKLERLKDLDWYDANNNISFAQADALVNTFIKKTAVLGLSINSTITGNNLNVTVKVGMGQALNIAKAKVMVYVMEGGLTGPAQNNYYSLDQVKNDYINDPDLGPLTKLAHSITGYTYNHVVRKVLTDAKGDEIPAAYKIKGAVYSKDFTLDISKYKAANCSIIALVYGQDDEGKLIDTYNSQVVVAGQSQKFD
ncbi:Omp28-related outer membrane protein [Chitinophaga sp. G-6-1-13]|uniref:Omp28-related outer membrane protein n=1 Tax=Chitinophaga fulva TaxID=2728842 RepID=A0A848GNU7_9BACT|nr:Omp28-related outer membrane protein [Chitinophaga fulva]NML40285.1 Omp28-related outer membrane protein [Chitinophaga fulva]